jgi:hypothetical protein
MKAELHLLTQDQKAARPTETKLNPGKKDNRHGE